MMNQDKKPVIWLAGDSTMQSYFEENRPQWGWGELLLEKLEAALERNTKRKQGRVQDEQVGRVAAEEVKIATEEVKITAEVKKGEGKEALYTEIPMFHREDSPFPQQKRYIGRYFIADNCAMAGRSSKTFWEEGRLQDIADHIQEEDYLLIQFGHNDAGKGKPERYVALEDFKASLKHFIDVAFTHGAKPILLSSIVLCPSPETEQGDAGEISRLLPLYGEEMRKYAQELNIPFVDMNGLTRACIAEKTKEEAERLYMPDHVHLVRAGAEKYAELAAGELRGHVREGVKEANL